MTCIKYTKYVKFHLAGRNTKLNDKYITLIIYEAHFHLPICVNKQKSARRYRKIHSNSKCANWYGALNFRITGPYFFEDDVMVTSF